MLELLILKKILILLQSEEDISFWSEEQLQQYLDIKANRSLDIKEYDLLYAEVVGELSKTYGHIGSLVRLNDLKNSARFLMPKYRLLRLGSDLSLLITTINHLYAKIEKQMMPNISYALVLSFEKMKEGFFDETKFFASIFADRDPISITSQEEIFNQTSLFRDDDTAIRKDHKYDEFVATVLARENYIASCQKLLRENYTNEELTAYSEELVHLLEIRPSKENKIRLELIQKCISKVTALPHKKTNQSRNKDQLVLEKF